jgi:hypothetical protein
VLFDLACASDINPYTRGDTAVFTKTKITICVAIVVGAASAGFAKDQNSRRDRAEGAVQSNGRLHSFAQGPADRQTNCWVPEADQGGEYGADTRGIGHWGSCREKGAVRSK